LSFDEKKNIVVVGFNTKKLVQKKEQLKWGQRVTKALTPKAMDGCSEC